MSSDEVSSLNWPVWHGSADQQKWTCIYLRQHVKDFTLVSCGLKPPYAWRFASFGSTLASERRIVLPRFHSSIMGWTSSWWLSVSNMIGYQLLIIFIQTFSFIMNKIFIMNVGQLSPTACYMRKKTEQTMQDIRISTKFRKFFFLSLSHPSTAFSNNRLWESWQITLLSRY